MCDRSNASRRCFGLARRETAGLVSVDTDSHLFALRDAYRAEGYEYPDAYRWRVMLGTLE